MRASSPYSEHTSWSEPERFAELVWTWPLDPVGLSEAIAERLVHIRSDEGKGHVDQDCLRQDLPLRSTPELLAASEERRRDGGPSKVGAVCRDFALLAVSAFRSRGVPARLRVGFADYFTEGFFEDHWLCEWRDGDRWRRLDVEVAAGAAPSRTPFDPADVPHGRICTATEAWATTRRRPEDAESYGVSAFGLAGRWFIAGNVYRDAAALSCVEMKPWDYWGLGLSLEIDRVKVSVEIERDVDKLSNILERSDVDNVSCSLPPVQECRTFVAEDEDGVIGFYMLDGAELSKLYVRREARGSGIAQALLSHAESGLASGGVAIAELFCTVGNARAQRFYERHGWRWASTFDDVLWCPDPSVDVPAVPTHRYTKTLS